VLVCDGAAAALNEARGQGLVADDAVGGALAGGEVPHVQVGRHCCM
jgi:hypothetical protein